MKPKEAHKLLNEYFADQTAYDPEIGEALDTLYRAALVVKLLDKWMEHGEDIALSKDAEGYWGQIWHGGIEMGVEFASGAASSLEGIMALLDDMATRYLRHEWKPPKEDSHLESAYEDRTYFED